VKPLGFRLDDKSLQRSGLDYHDLTDVRVHANLTACLSELGEARVFAVETSGTRRYSDVIHRAGDALLFGPETRGLPPDVLQRIGHEYTLAIPMRPQSRSLNLSNAVAIVAFHAWQTLGYAGS
jgi:tRNA (cytidine/uridine-2'-O-)-methyltransferase